jgi:hypothetical protein
MNFVGSFFSDIAGIKYTFSVKKDGGDIVLFEARKRELITGVGTRAIGRSLYANGKFHIKKP